MSFVFISQFSKQVPQAKRLGEISSKAVVERERTPCIKIKGGREAVFSVLSKRPLAYGSRLYKIGKMALRDSGV
jgi:hypothetical protein